MTIYFNNRALELEKEYNLEELLASQSLQHKAGIAIALNNKVVPKEMWKQTIIKDDDRILAIGASYGG